MLLWRNSAIRLLFLSQALYWTCAMLGITLASIIGMQLAPTPALATLPLAMLVVGNLVSVHPLSMLMQRRGRRPGLMLGAAMGVAGGLVSAGGVWIGSFTVFCAGGLLIGTYQASAMYYRFAALEAVTAAEKGRATAYVIGGGVAAALLAPTLALWSEQALPVAYAGTYLLVALLALAGMLAMAGLREGAAPQAGVAGLATLRSLLQRPLVRAALLTTLTGHGTMVLVMTATPLAMLACGFGTEHSASVIQWHVLGMFLPAFVAGPLVDRFGNRRVALAGIFILLVSASVALSDLSKLAFLISSFCLGMGWNLMLVAGTTLLAEGHSEQERGQAQGLMELSNGITATIASFAAGALISGVGWTAVNLGVLALLATTLFMLRASWRRPATAAALADS